MILMFCLVSQVSLGYSFTDDFIKGYFWKDLPLDFSISEFDAKKKENLTGLVKAAARIWEDGVNGKMWSFEDTASGKNIIRWAVDFEKETGFDAESTLAVTIRYNDSPYWAKAEVILNPTKEFLKLDPVALQFVLMHELGHTMGLSHSDDEDSVMKASYNGDASFAMDQGLSSDDYEGMSEALKTMNTRKSQPQVLSASASENKSSDGLSCGTVDLGSGGSGPNGPLQFLISIVLGMLFILVGSNERLSPVKIIR